MQASVRAPIALDFFPRVLGVSSIIIQDLPDENHMSAFRRKKSSLSDGWHSLPFLARLFNPLNRISITVARRAVAGQESSPDALVIGRLSLCFQKSNRTLRYKTDPMSHACSCIDS